MMIIIIMSCSPKLQENLIQYTPKIEKNVSSKFLFIENAIKGKGKTSENTLG